MPRKKSGYDSLTVQIPQDLAKKVRYLAREEGRHLSKMVEILIQDGLNKHEIPVTQSKLFDSTQNGGINS
jgi:rubrerythrin